VTLTIARIIPAEALGDSAPVLVPKNRVEPRAAIVPASVVDAAERARGIVERAEARARELLAQAESDVARLRASVTAEARAAAVAELAAHTLELARREAEADVRATERLVELARLLAERLLGEALRLEPRHVVSLAESALSEARGARSVILVAHPDDAPELERALERGELERVTRVVRNPERARGSLRLETEIGILDAGLAPQLDRLAVALRTSLRS